MKPNHTQREDLDNFRSSLDDLTSDRVSIQFFTEILMEKVSLGQQIANIVFEKILSSPKPGGRLSLFYLIDSVVKNKAVGSRYQSYFSPNLYDVFSKCYTQTNDEYTKQRYLKLFKTWYYIFPHPVLFKIDQFLSRQNRGVTVFNVAQATRRPARVFLVNPDIFGASNIPPQQIVRQPPPRMGHGMMHSAPPNIMRTHHPQGGGLRYPAQPQQRFGYTLPNPGQSHPGVGYPNTNVPPTMNLPPHPAMMNQPSHLPMYPKMNPMVSNPQMRANVPSPTTPTKDELFDLAKQVENELKSKEEERYVTLVNSLYSDFPLKCQKCGLRFRMQQNLDRHLDKHFTMESEKHFARQWWTKSSEEWVNKSDLNILKEVLLDPTKVIFGDSEKKRMRIETGGMGRGGGGMGREGEGIGMADEVFIGKGGSDVGRPGMKKISKPSVGGNGGVSKMESEGGLTLEDGEVLFDESKEKCVFCNEKIRSKFHMKYQEWIFLEAIRVDPSSFGIKCEEFGLKEDYFFVVHKNCGMNDSISKPNIILVLQQERERVLTQSPQPDDHHQLSPMKEADEDDDDTGWFSERNILEDGDEEEEDEQTQKKGKEEEESKSMKEEEEQEEDKDLLPKKRKIQEIQNVPDDLDHENVNIEKEENLEPPKKRMKT